MQKSVFDSLTKLAARVGDSKVSRATRPPAIDRRSFITLATLTLIARFAGSIPSTSLILAQQPQSNEARALFKQAEQFARAGRPDEALNSLRQSFERLFPTPGDVLEKEAFQSLLRNPVQRQQLRRLLREFARQSVVTMVSANEPGDRLTIHGELRDARSTKPVPGALVFLYHTDNEGLYAPEQSRAGAGSENPRLFCYVKADNTGRFELHTIRPASYPGTRNMRHVHVEIEAAGYGSFNSQFYINGDPAADEERRRIAAQRDWPIVDPVRVDESHYTCNVVLRLRPAAR